MNLFLMVNDIKTGTQKTYTTCGTDISVLSMPIKHLTSSAIYKGEVSGSAKRINKTPGTAITAIIELFSVTLRARIAAPQTRHMSTSEITDRRSGEKFLKAHHLFRMQKREKLPFQNLPHFWGDFFIETTMDDPASIRMRTFVRSVFS